MTFWLSTRLKKTVQVRDLNTGITSEDTYDKLVLTTGSWPIVPWKASD